MLDILKLLVDRQTQPASLARTLLVAMSKTAFFEKDVNDYHDFEQL